MWRLFSNERFTVFFAYYALSFVDNLIEQVFNEIFKEKKTLVPY